MLRAGLISLMVLLLPLSAAAQNFGGLKVGSSSDPVATWSGLIALEQSGADRFAKFRMPDGHTLSITTRNFGPIIYLESNRGDGTSPATGTGLLFGTTTLANAQTMLGNPGFNYATRKTVRLPQQGDVHFMSYQLENQPGVVATFAFKLEPARAALTRDDALLDGLIIAQEWYLDEIWGTDKTANPGYAPVTLTY